MKLSGRRKDPESPGTGVLPQNSRQCNITLKLHKARCVVRHAQIPTHDCAIDNLYDAPVRDDRPARI